MAPARPQAPEPFCLACVSAFLGRSGNQGGTYTLLFASQNPQLPPIWGVNLPQEVGGLGVPHTGAVLGLHLQLEHPALCMKRLDPFREEALPQWEWRSCYCTSSFWVFRAIDLPLSRTPLFLLRWLTSASATLGQMSLSRQAQALRYHHEEDVICSRCGRDFGRFRSLARLCWSAHLSRTRRLSVLVGLCRCPQLDSRFPPATGIASASGTGMPGACAACGSAG